MSRSLVFLVSACLLNGCGWMNDDKGLVVDRSDDYLDAQQEPPLRIPEGLDAGALKDTLAIPELGEQPRTVFYSKEAPRPNSVFARENGQQVKIQKLGEERWLVVAQKPSIVWPKVKQFLSDNGIELTSEDPHGGLLETVWLEVSIDETYRDIVRSSLQVAKQTETLASGREKLRIKLEQGLRVGSTEIYIRHENDSGEFANPIASASVDYWPEESVLKTIEAVLLNELGGYIAADVAQPSESMQAIELAARRKAEVKMDKEGNPYLRFDLDFNRAWAVIGQALNSAEIEVSDLDRSAGVFYVDLTAEDLLQDDAPGFFAGLFNRGSDDDSMALQIRMSEQDSDQVVRIFAQEDQLAELEISQQLLTLLRDFAG